MFNDLVPQYPASHPVLRRIRRVIGQSHPTLRGTEPYMPPPKVEVDENLLVVNFDGSSRVKKKGGAYSAIVWKLPEWTIVAATS